MITRVGEQGSRGQGEQGRYHDKEASQQNATGWEGRPSCCNNIKPRPPCSSLTPPSLPLSPKVSRSMSPVVAPGVKALPMASIRASGSRSADSKPAAELAAPLEAVAAEAVFFPAGVPGAPPTDAAVPFIGEAPGPPPPTPPPPPAVVFLLLLPLVAVIVAAEAAEGVKRDLIA